MIELIIMILRTLSWFLVVAYAITGVLRLYIELHWIWNKDMHYSIK